MTAAAARAPAETAQAGLALGVAVVMAPCLVAVLGEEWAQLTVAAAKAQAGTAPVVMATVGAEDGLRAWWR